MCIWQGPDIAMTWHIVTPEFAPACGGVADHSKLVAQGLYDVGEKVHVWTGTSSVHAHPTTDRVEATVHDVTFGPSGLRRLSHDLDAVAQLTQVPNRVLIQYVPTAFPRAGRTSALSSWLGSRAAAGDQIWLFVHEPGIDAHIADPRTWALAPLHRRALREAISASHRVLLATDAWRPHVTPHLNDQNRDLRVVGVPSPIVPSREPPRATMRTESQIVLTWGLLSSVVRTGTADIVCALLAARPDLTVLILGKGGPAVKVAAESRARRSLPALVAPGEAPLSSISRWLGTVAAAFQWYPDGITTRRTTAMAALAHATPLVTNAGHLSEPFWTASQAVSLASNNRPSTLADELVALLNDPVKARAIGSAGRELYELRFCLDRTIAALAK